MPIIINKDLYDMARKITDEKFGKKTSAYRSAFLVKTYKQMGGLYKDDFKEKKLSRWFNEKWVDVGNREYPVFRPLIRMTEDTPLTLDEIDKQNLKKQIKLKQIIKGNKNLPPFKKKKNLFF